MKKIETIMEKLEVHNAVFYREHNEIYVTHEDYAFDKELVKHINLGFLQPNVASSFGFSVSSNKWDVIYGVELASKVEFRPGYFSGYFVARSYLVYTEDIEPFFKGFENIFIYTRFLSDGY